MTPRFYSALYSNWHEFEALIFADPAKLEKIILIMKRKSVN